MRRRNLIIGAAVLVAAAAAAAVGLNRTAEPDDSPMGRVNAAYEAMGDEAVDAVRTISLRARLQQWDPGASYSVSTPEMPDAGYSDLIQGRDYERDLTYNQWDRPKADDGGRRVFTEIVTPTAGWVVGNNAVNGRTPARAIMVDDKPAQTMSGRRLTATLRELERLDIVRAMRRNPERVTEFPDQMIEGVAYPAVQYTSPYGTFIVLFDPMTRLPARVRTPDWDALEGDSVFEVEYQDWREMAETMMPFRYVYTLNGKRVGELTIMNLMVNPAFPAGLFEIPADQLAMAAGPADPGITPFQWIIRRQFSGFYFDSDTMYGDDGSTLTLTDVTPYIAITQGWTHNTVFIDAGPYLIAVEAPNDDGQSRQAIALAKERFPGKPIRYLVLTHHHVDHVGGMRSYAAEGAAIVVGPGNGDFFREVLARPQTLNWNAPQNYTPPEVIEVTDRWSAPEATREITFYTIDNPHSAGMLMGYVPAARLGLITDLWITGPRPTAANPNLAAVVDAVTRLRLNPLRFTGGHGGVGDYAPVVQLVRAAAQRR